MATYAGQPGTLLSAEDFIGTAAGQFGKVTAAEGFTETVPAASDEEMAPLAQTNAAALKSTAVFTLIIPIAPQQTLPARLKSDATATL
jgi:hypothetical protein